jgi:hypothetical protein
MEHRIIRIQPLPLVCKEGEVTNFFQYSADSALYFMTLHHVPSDSRFEEPGNELQVLILLLLLTLVSDGRI